MPCYLFIYLFIIIICNSTLCRNNVWEEPASNDVLPLKPVSNVPNWPSPELDRFFRNSSPTWTSVGYLPREESADWLAISKEQAISQSFVVLHHFVCLIDHLRGYCVPRSSVRPQLPDDFLSLASQNAWQHTYISNCSRENMQPCSVNRFLFIYSFVINGTA